MNNSNFTLSLTIIQTQKTFAAAVFMVHRYRPIGVHLHTPAFTACTHYLIYGITYPILGG